MIHPFARLMRRYVIDYTNSHDQSVCDEIMHPDYEVHISGMTLRRDASYRAAVSRLYEEYPALELEVHDVVTNGKRLAMRFTEHGASLRHEGRVAAWSGIGVYEWNGTQLTRNYVEQDFFARRTQLATGSAADIEPPHHDPWVGAWVGEPAEDVEAHARSWLEAGNLTGADIVVDRNSTPVALDNLSIDVTTLFSAGSKVAFHAVQRGRFVSGLFEDDAEFAGESCTLQTAGIVNVTSGQVTSGHLVTDREGTRTTLRQKRR